MAHRMISYGYGIENGEIVVLPTEAEIVKNIFDSYSRGENLKKIAADLTERNIVFFENRSTWSKAVVMRILENKRYIGNDGYPAIIDVDLFEKINRAKNEKSHKKAKQPEIIGYLKTVMFCGECGKPIHRRGDWGTHEKWHCSGGCRCKKYADDNFILCGIKRLLSAVCDDLRLLSKTTEAPTYTKTQEILRYTNEIGRYMNERAPGFKAGKKLILECAALKFSACTYNANETIAACIAEQLSQEQEYLSKEFLQKIIERISVHKNGMLTIRFIGGIDVSESELEKQYGSAS